MLRRWMPTIAVSTGGVVLAVVQVATGSGAGGLAVAVPFVVLALLLSPAAFPRSVGEVEARRRSALDGRPIVYWRPGCPYCLRLRARLGRRAGRLHWVDIWRDPEAAAAVRAVAGGNETVPTVMMDGRAHVNPDPAWLRGRLREG